MGNESRNPRSGAAEFLGGEAGRCLPHVADLPIAAVVQAFQMATRQAALDAVAAGRIVVGWENGKLTEHGPNAPPASPPRRSDD